MPCVQQTACVLRRGVEEMSPAEKIRYRNMEDFGFGPNVMKKTKICAKCGRMAEANARTCPECGERLSGETLFDRYKRQHKCCPDCDTVLTEDAKYCPHCGIQIISNHQKTHQRRSFV